MGRITPCWSWGRSWLAARALLAEVQDEAVPYPTAFLHLISPSMGQELSHSIWAGWVVGCGTSTALGRARPHPAPSWGPQAA